MTQLKFNMLLLFFFLAVLGWQAKLIGAVTLSKDLHYIENLELHNQDSSEMPLTSMNEYELDQQKKIQKQQQKVNSSQEKHSQFQMSLADREQDRIIKFLHLDLMQEQIDYIKSFYFRIYLKICIHMNHNKLLMPLPVIVLVVVSYLIWLQRQKQELILKIPNKKEINIPTPQSANVVCQQQQYTDDAYSCGDEQSPYTKNILNDSLLQQIYQSKQNQSLFNSLQNSKTESSYFSDRDCILMENNCKNNYICNNNNVNIDWKLNSSYIEQQFQCNYNSNNASATAALAQDQAIYEQLFKKQKQQQQQHKYMIYDYPPEFKQIKIKEVQNNNLLNRSRGGVTNCDGGQVGGDDTFIEMEHSLNKTSISICENDLRIGVQDPSNNDSNDSILKMLNQPIHQQKPTK